MDANKLKEKYEIFSGIEEMDKLIEILDKLKEKNKIIVNYYLENVVIQIGILCTNLLGEEEEINFELVNEDLEDENITKYLANEIKRLKNEEEENEESNEENKSGDEENKKSETDEEEEIENDKEK